ncbi:MAG: hypothetical protein J6Y54_09165 [Lentisphaeria bacterium]|nr:hypothetical protein [Lentisphaeria bacterium]
MPRKTDIRTLLSLLDDEDEGPALEAMAELLWRGEEVFPYLAELQESPDPLLRRRVHQLESALTMRRRRSEFSRLLSMPHPDVPRILVELHLQWYDNDPLPEMASRLTAFLASGRAENPRSLADLSSYFRKSGIVAERETTLRPEDYCIGVMLLDRIGSAAVWTLVAKLLLPDPDAVKIVRNVEEFSLYDGERLLLPERDWRIVRAPARAELELWDERKVLKFAASMLFSAAVNSDSFRYVLTIGQAFSGLPDDEVLDYMPYPYRPAPEEDAPAERT